MASRSMEESSASTASRPGRRRVLTSLSALPAGAVLATAGAAAAAPAKGNGKGKGKRRFRLGVENLLEGDQLSLLEGAKVGLVTNPTGTDSTLTSTIDLLLGAQEKGGFELVALFGPEHGLRGAAQAGASDDLGLD